MGQATWNGPFSPALVIVEGRSRQFVDGVTQTIPDATCAGLRNSDPFWWSVALAEAPYPSPTRYPSTTLYPL